MNTDKHGWQRDLDINGWFVPLGQKKRRVQIMGMEERLEKITERIIGCSYTVSNTLGAGFLEKVYENALVHELRKNGVAVQQQHPIKILYDGEIVGDFTADLLAENEVLIELKAAKALDDVHMAQCINYLKATGLKVCLLINFGTPRIEIKRILN